MMEECRRGGDAGGGRETGAGERENEKQETEDDRVVCFPRTRGETKSRGREMGRERSRGRERVKTECSQSFAQTRGPRDCGGWDSINQPRRAAQEIAVDGII